MKSVRDLGFSLHHSQSFSVRLLHKITLQAKFYKRSSGLVQVGGIVQHPKYRPKCQSRGAELQKISILKLRLSIL